MKVLVTGAGGMMGSHLTEMLRDMSHDVLPTYYKPTIPIGDLRHLDPVEMDITDWCSVHDVVASFVPDAIFHLAAQSYPTTSWARPTETLTTNVIGTSNVFEVARRLCPDARLVVAGSSAEYGVVEEDQIPVKESHTLQPLHPYGVSKVATDLLAHQYFSSYGTAAVTARIFNCTGPRKTGDAVSDFVRRCVLLEQQGGEPTLRVGNLESQRTFVDVRDLNRALILLMEQGEAGAAYNVGGDTIYRMGDIVDRVIAECTVGGVTPVVDPALLRPTDEKIIYGDCSRLKSETGWEQELTLEETVADMFNYWRNKPTDASIA